MDNEGAHLIPRRTVLKGIGGLGLAVAVGPKVFTARGFRHPLATELVAVLSGDPAPLQVYLYRRDDLLDVRFDLYNLELNTSGPGPVLVPTVGSNPSWVVAVFPFQSIAEFDTTVTSTYKYPTPLSTQTPVRSLAAGPSQVAFEVPSTVTSIPFTVAGLLNWQVLSPLLPAVAAQSGKVSATDPTTSTSPPLTYIEMAWQLLVSPDPTSVWESAPAPIANETPNGTWTELWQARLVGTRPFYVPGQVYPTNPLPASIYAVWTPGYPVAKGGPSQPAGPSFPSVPDPFPTSLSDINTPPGNANRLGLVALSSYAGNTNIDLPGVAAQASTFLLTGLGASTDIAGAYNNGAASDIVAWKHRMSIGRDTFVQVVHAGYLYPFGNRALLVQTTDREFQVSPEGDVVAYLIERNTILVNEPVVRYPYVDPGAVDQPHAGRANPFVQIEFKTTVTPALDLPTGKPNPIPHVATGAAQWIMVNKQPFPFILVGTDAEGRDVVFNSAAIWVAENPVTKVVKDVGASWTKEIKKKLLWTQSPLGGQLLALAPPAVTAGATALHVDNLIFNATVVNSTSETSPPWYPVMTSATVHLPAVSALSGAAGDDTTPGPLVTYNATYLATGFDDSTAGVPQKPEVFLNLSTGSSLDFSSASQSAQSGTSLSGGVVSPGFSIDGFARDLGPVADAAHLVAGTFNPATFFSSLPATLLGTVELSKIVAPQSGPAASANAPKIVSVPVYDPPAVAPVATRTTIDWTPALQQSGYFIPSNNPIPSSPPATVVPAQLTIKVDMYAPLGAGSPSSVIDGQLENFSLSLFGLTDTEQCVVVVFTAVNFRSRTGSKSDVQVVVESVTFVNALSFIQTFEDLFQSLGGPSIDVEPSGITASYTVSIPSISLGVFGLENLSLGGSLNIPFTGQPVRLEVNFCSRDNPFLLAIYVFNGGGWFTIRLGADGIELVEVGLEFGAGISLDLGVASGGVSIEAGIYFALGSNTVELQGFFKASGNLEVLGIISISIVFYLGLTYLDPGSTYGTASVSVTVSVLCFSASVTMTVTKTISSNDPPISFTDAIAPTDWQNYCAAFAA